MQTDNYLDLEIVILNISPIMIALLNLILL